MGRLTDKNILASKKTVIVTGASQGIGAAVVQVFLVTSLRPRAAFLRPASHRHRTSYSSMETSVRSQRVKYDS